LKADPREIAAVFAGGMIGAGLRVALFLSLAVEVGAWPWAILIVNVSGAFVLGYFMARMQERLPVSTYGPPFVGTGLGGGMTAFSMMQFELFIMIELGYYVLAAGYAAVSMMAGLLAVSLGTGLVRRSRLDR
jgi:fluoride exporter